MTARGVSLDDKYRLDEGRAFMTGIQALVRLPLDRKRLDRRAGLNTAGFISGYRGSPLGGYDQQLAAARSFLEAHDVRVWEGLNEDLGATAVWGSQQAQAFPGARYDGVFGLWYGKAPGVDRTGDVFKHANMAGTDPRGGVLALVGDDPNCKSSTLPSQSEFALIDAEMPILSPSSIQDVLDYGQAAWEISRYSGAWVGMIALADTMDSAAVVQLGLERHTYLRPADFELPSGGLGLRIGDTPMAKERRLREFKLPAAQAFARANSLDHVLLHSPSPRIGLIVSGQSARDVFEALAAIGLDESEAAALGISIYKVAMTWPLEPEGISRFCRGLERVLVLEHKRAVIEPQLKSALYHLPDTERPVVEGKTRRDGAPFLSELATLSTADIARALMETLPEGPHTLRAQRYFEKLAGAGAPVSALQPINVRTPHFCSGCPHNTSTRLPEGSRALAGIGCHYMATFSPDRRTDMHTQMGGEGAPWIGLSPFTEERHVFVNLGDGTYSHSGSLAIRASVSAGVNVTYKILYNDAVAMTGGQAVESGQTVPQIARQVEAEGVRTIVIVADDTTRYASVSDLPEGVRIFDRSRFDDVQQELRTTPGVSVLIYDQVCATEKRRRIKRGRLAAPQKRAFINTAVCEGCGDCSVQSNCLSIEPVETEFGRKRRINQSTCNTDLSCVNGFCPSFVTVEGAEEAPRGDISPPVFDVARLTVPVLPASDRVWSVVFTGVGGTGVTTIAAILAMAAHIDGRAAQTLDMTGLAQKGGPVLSHVRFARTPESIRAARTPPQGADALIACDLIVASSPDALGLLDPVRTRVAACSDVTPTKEVIDRRDARFDAGRLGRRVASRAAGYASIDAEALAEHHLGDAIYTNMVMVGAAWQMGLLPVSAEAVLQAVRLNRVQVDMNVAAFQLGRIAVEDPDQVRVGRPVRPTDVRASLDEFIARRIETLIAYQDLPYAEIYRSALARLRASEADKGLGEELSYAAASELFRLMAYKDEYEVARLYSDPAYMRSVVDAFGPNAKLTFLLAPPLISRRRSNGELIKRRFGPWMMHVFRVLRAGKWMRGKSLDPFGWTAERRMERRLRDDYLKRLDEIAQGLTLKNHPLAVEIASVTSEIRGFGHVKEKSVIEAERRLAGLMERWRAGYVPSPRQAAE